MIQILGHFIQPLHQAINAVNYLHTNTSFAIRPVGVAVADHCMVCSVHPAGTFGSLMFHTSSGYLFSHISRDVKPSV